jgi:predicted RNA-binding Zn-ribbon protein involved in translation (DUF1610 family)
MTLLEQQENLLCGPGSNVAIEAGNSDYIFYLCGKEGFILKYGWEREFIKYMEANPDVGLAGNLVNLPHHYDGKTYQEYSRFPQFRNQDFARNHPHRPFQHVQGGVYVLRRAAYEDVGGFSEAVPHNGMDIEYSYYLESCGWKLGRVPNVWSMTVLTLPGLHAVMDEESVVAHPLDVEKVQRYDRIVSKQVHACNVCGYTGASLIERGNELYECPECGSREFARSLLKYLAQSELVYRDIPCVAFLQETSLCRYLSSMFALKDTIEVGGSGKVDIAKVRDAMSQCQVLVLDNMLWEDGEVSQLVDSIANFVSRGGRVFVGENASLLNNRAGVRIGDMLEQRRVAYEALEDDSLALNLDWLGIYDCYSRD